MDLGLKNKTALVLASSKGIGKAVAQALVGEGASVAICSSNKENIEKTKKEIGADISIVADLSTGGGGKEAALKALKHFGKLDILVTNNGGPPHARFEETREEEWEKYFKSVFLSAEEAIKTVIASMKSRKFGRIIVLNSKSSIEPTPGLLFSNALRPSLNGLVKDLSRAYAKEGITINLIQTGYTETDRLKNAGFDLEKILKEIPVRRLGRPEELGALAAFLASDMAGYITGQSIAFDGGSLHCI